MSGDDFQSRYASVMDGMLRGAVAETTRLFQTMVDELKKEINAIKQENAELRSKCMDLEVEEEESSTTTTTTTGTSTAAEACGREEPPREDASCCPGTSEQARRDSAIQCDLVRGREAYKPLKSKCVQEAVDVKLPKTDGDGRLVTKQEDDKPTTVYHLRVFKEKEGQVKPFVRRITIEIPKHQPSCEKGTQSQGTLLPFKVEQQSDVIQHIPVTETTAETSTPDQDEPVIVPQKPSVAQLRKKRLSDVVATPTKKRPSPKPVLLPSRKSGRTPKKVKSWESPKRRSQASCLAGDPENDQSLSARADEITPVKSPRRARKQKEPRRSAIKRKVESISDYLILDEPTAEEEAGIPPIDEEEAEECSPPDPASPPARETASIKRSPSKSKRVLEKRAEPTLSSVNENASATETPVTPSTEFAKARSSAPPRERRTSYPTLQEAMLLVEASNVNFGLEGATGNVDAQITSALPESQNHDDTNVPPKTTAPMATSSTVAPAVTPSTIEPTFTPPVAPSTIEPTVTPLLSQATIEPTVTPPLAPSTIEPLVTPPVAPSTIEPTVSPPLAPSTIEPLVTPPVAPSTIEPLVTPPVAPSTIEPTVTPPLAPSTIEPLVTPPVAPSTIEPTVTPPLALAAVASVRSSPKQCLLPSITITLLPNASPRKIIVVPRPLAQVIATHSPTAMSTAIANVVSSQRNSLPEATADERMSPPSVASTASSTIVANVVSSQKNSLPQTIEDETICPTSVSTIPVSSCTAVVKRFKDGRQLLSISPPMPPPSVVPTATSTIVTNVASSQRNVLPQTIADETISPPQTPATSSASTAFIDPRFPKLIVVPLQLSVFKSKRHNLADFAEIASTSTQKPTVDKAGTTTTETDTSTANAEITKQDASIVNSATTKASSVNSVTASTEMVTSELTATSTEKDISVNLETDQSPSAGAEEIAPVKSSKRGRKPKEPRPSASKAEAGIPPADKETEECSLVVPASSPGRDHASMKPCPSKSNSDTAMVSPVNLVTASTTIGSTDPAVNSAVSTTENDTSINTIIVTTAVNLAPTTTNVSPVSSATTTTTVTSAVGVRSASATTDVSGNLEATETVKPAVNSAAIETNVSTVNPATKPVQTAVNSTTTTINLSPFSSAATKIDTSTVNAAVTSTEIDMSSVSIAATSTKSDTSAVSVEKIETDVSALNSAILATKTNTPAFNSEASSMKANTSEENSAETAKERAVNSSSETKMDTSTVHSATTCAPAVDSAATSLKTNTSEENLAETAKEKDVNSAAMLTKMDLSTVNSASTEAPAVTLAPQRLSQSTRVTVAPQTDQSPSARADEIAPVKSRRGRKPKEPRPSAIRRKSESISEYLNTDGPTPEENMPTVSSTTTEANLSTVNSAAAEAPAVNLTPRCRSQVSGVTTSDPVTDQSPLARVDEIPPVKSRRGRKPKEPRPSAIKRKAESISEYLNTDEATAEEDMSTVSSATTSTKMDTSAVGSVTTKADTLSVNSATTKVEKSNVSSTTTDADSSTAISTTTLTKTDRSTMEAPAVNSAPEHLSQLVSVTVDPESDQSPSAREDEISPVKSPKRRGRKPKVPRPSAIKRKVESINTIEPTAEEVLSTVSSTITAQTNTAGCKVAIISTADVQTLVPSSVPPVVQQKTYPVVKLTRLTLSPALRKQIPLVLKTPATDFCSSVKNLPTVKKQPITTNVQDCLPPIVAAAEKPADGAVKSAQPTEDSLPDADDDSPGPWEDSPDSLCIQTSVSTEVTSAVREKSSAIKRIKQPVASTGGNDLVSETLAPSTRTRSSSKDNTSDPHQQMTKTQFLSQMEMLPVDRDKKRVRFSDTTATPAEMKGDTKRVDKNSLVNKLRSHRRHIKSQQLQPSHTEPNPVVLTEERQPTPDPEPNPAVKEPEPTPVPELKPTVEEPAPAPEQTPAEEEITPAPETKAAVNEPTPAPEPTPPVEEITPAPEPTPVVEEPSSAPEPSPVVEEPEHAHVAETSPVGEETEPTPAPDPSPVVDESTPAPEPTPIMDESTPAPEPSPVVEEPEPTPAPEQSPVVEEIESIPALEPSPVVEETTHSPETSLLEEEPTLAPEPSPVEEEPEPTPSPAPSLVDEDPTSTSEPSPVEEEPTPVTEPSPVEEEPTPVTEPSPVEEEPIPASETTVSPSTPIPAKKARFVGEDETPAETSVESCQSTCTNVSSCERIPPVGPERCEPPTEEVSTRKKAAAKGSPFSPTRSSLSKIVAGLKKIRSDHSPFRPKTLVPTRESREKSKYSSTAIAKRQSLMDTTLTPKKCRKTVNTASKERLRKEADTLRFSKMKKAKTLVQRTKNSTQSEVEAIPSQSKTKAGLRIIMKEAKVVLTTPRMDASGSPVSKIRIPSVNPSDTEAQTKVHTSPTPPPFWTAPLMIPPSPPRMLLAPSPPPFHLSPSPPPLRSSPSPPPPIPFSLSSIKSEFRSPASSRSPSPFLFKAIPHSCKVRSGKSGVFRAPPIVSPLQPLSVLGRRLLKNQCGQCGRVFPTAALLESHVPTHKNLPPFTCGLCGKSFLNNRAVNRHHKGHREIRNYKCEQCGKAYSHKFTLTKHVQMVHGRVKPFVCQICKKEFYTKQEVNSHIRVHTGETPYHCHLCEKKFKRTMDLNKHLRWHNGEKRYWCPYCDKGFLEANNLKMHKYTHTGEKPRACPHCPKRFIQIGHLRKHLRTVHKHETETQA